MEQPSDTRRALKYCTPGQAGRKANATKKKHPCTDIDRRVPYNWPMQKIDAKNIKWVSCSFILHHFSIVMRTAVMRTFALNSNAFERPCEDHALAQIEIRMEIILSFFISFNFASLWPTNTNSIDKQRLTHRLKTFNYSMATVDGWTLCRLICVRLTGK